jgi:hypothetical protein
MAKGDAVKKDDIVAYWDKEITKAKRRFLRMHESGEIVVDQYRIEREDATRRIRGTDRYNILYSSTETIKPSLYAQTPKIEAEKRHRDRTNPVADAAVSMIESSVTYAIGEVNFDDIIQNAVQDYLLPGLGTVWLRYEATYKDEPADADGNIPQDENGKNRQIVDYEKVCMDYTYWKDILYGVCRVWDEMPWISKRVYMDKDKAEKRFGKNAAYLSYGKKPASDRSGNEGEESDEAQATIWEIWHREHRKVYWYSEGCPKMLDERDDILGLKDFFPTPRPLRAITTTRTFVPRPFYSQYQSQAEHLNDMTKRIRILTSALRVVGLYDSSITQLSKLLENTDSNKMIACDSWAMFAQNGGMNGVIAWFPLQEIVNTLGELLKQRDVVKAEIYEITGFSDIVRGVSKASETLGAQEIKTDWSTARLKVMQREVQRFCLDVIRIMAEIVSEKFSKESIALYTGLDAQPPNGEDPQAVMAYQQVMQTFQAAYDMLKKERERCAIINIETDSTILADEQKDRADRMAMLAAMGAYLQQAGPMIMQFPEMRGILVAMMMFTLRTFPSSRPLEKEFEAFSKAIESMPATDPKAKQGEQGDGGAAAAQGKVQGDQIKAQATVQIAGMKDATDKMEIQTDAQVQMAKETNRHNEKIRELELREREVAVKEMELGIKREEVGIKRDEVGAHIQMDQQDQVRQDEAQQHSQGMAEVAASQQDRAQDTAEQQAAAAAKEPPKKED